MNASSAIPRWLAELGPQFLRFCCVGVAGFVVDAGVLLTLVHSHLLNPVSGRFVSFTVAVIVTFELNRRWSFRESRKGGVLRLFGGYLAVQGLGFLSNLGIYTLLYVVLPKPFNAPLLCLAVASMFAMAMNFVGARWMVFRRVGARQPAARSD